MRPLWHRRNARAFTLVEMLVVIAIIAVLAALLLPALIRGKQRAQRIQCINNLEQTGTAFQMFAHDHRGKFPMQISTADGGSWEYVEAGTAINGTFYFSYRHLQTLANELVVPRILVCPSDQARQPAATFSTLQNSNVSYFVGAYANYDVPASVLAGDRNITNNAGATPSLVRGTAGLRWTGELHAFKGNVLFADAHVEQLHNDPVQLPAETAAGTVFFLPAVPAPPSSGIYSSPSSGSTPATAANYEPPVPARGSSPSSAIPQAAAPSAPTPMRMGGSSSQMAANEESSHATITETDARETNRATAPVRAQPAAAPAADDEPEPPLLWLLGAARGLVAKTSWWLLLLLLLLMAATLYFYARRKMRERRRRRA